MLQRMTNNKLLSLSFIMSLLISSSITLSADPFSKLNYSGRLTKDDGSVVEGPVDLRVVFEFKKNDGSGDSFEIDNNDTAGVPLDNGFFSLNLILTELNRDIIFAENTPVFIKLTDISDPSNEIAYPRQEFTATPFAIKAGSAATVPVDGTSLEFDSSTQKLKVKAGSSDGKVLATKSGKAEWKDIVDNANALLEFGDSGLKIKAGGDGKFLMTQGNQVVWGDGPVGGAELPSDNALTGDITTAINNITHTEIPSDNALTGDITTAIAAITHPDQTDHAPRDHTHHTKTIDTNTMRTDDEIRTISRQNASAWDGHIFAVVKNPQIDNHLNSKFYTKSQMDGSFLRKSGDQASACSGSVTTLGPNTTKVVVKSLVNNGAWVCNMDSVELNMTNSSNSDGYLRTNEELLQICGDNDGCEVRMTSAEGEIATYYFGHGLLSGHNNWSLRSGDAPKVYNTNLDSSTYTYEINGCKFFTGGRNFYLRTTGASTCRLKFID